MMTKYNTEIKDEMYSNALKQYINKFYKILPIRENNEPTLQKYMLSLQRELLGCQSLINGLDNDAQFLSLVSILQFLIDHECDVATVRTEVFHSIGLINIMLKRHEPNRKAGAQHGRVGKV